MFKEPMKFLGRVWVWKNGVMVQHNANLVVTVGKTLIATRLGSNTNNFISHMGLGSGATAPAAGDTALQTPLTPRVAVTFAPTGNAAVFTGHFGAGVATGTINEAGLFTDLTAGTMVSHVALSGIPKQASDVLDVVWEIDVN